MYYPLPKFLTIKDSGIHGLGLFATEDIPKGTKLGYSHYVLGKETIRTPLGGFYNHSDYPNCRKTTYTGGLASRHYVLKTIKDIEAGEEITVKYTFYKPGE